MSEVTVYGADWCQDTTRARQQLEQLSINYKYINVEQDPAASEWVKQQNDGKERKPTIKIGNQVLSTPDRTELEEALRQNGLVS